MADHRNTHTRQCRRAAIFSCASFLAGALLVAASSSAIAQANKDGTQAETCEGDNGGITLSPGFCATIFADNLGHARHLVFAPNGVLYVNTWSGRYYQDDTPPAGGFIVALKDSKGDGRAEVIKRAAIRVCDLYCAMLENILLGDVRAGICYPIDLNEIIRGHVGGVARGINVPNAQPDQSGLASVNPIFTWVRFAQRVPVRIHIDQVPDGVRLVAGMTATVQIDPRLKPSGR